MWKLLLASFLIFCFGTSVATAVAEPYTAVVSSGSATDQYAETIPSVGGNEYSENQGGGSPAGGGKGDGGTPEQFQSLENQGAVGAEAASVATATAPETSAADQAGVGQGQGSAASDTLGADGAASSLKYEEPDSGVLGTVSSSSDSGLGLLFPLMLLVALVGTVFLVMRGKRNQDLG